jgi:tetratricopeptide (TPR) repeat protein/sugar lactone lactonase YvrE
VSLRYRVIASLGKGGGGETFEAVRVADGVHVALKRLVVGQTRDWKTIELFEREARVLAALNHPAIPRYEDSFVVESAEGTSLYLVHHFAPGRSLRGWVEQGWHPDEVEILRITEFLLDVLAYLHTLAPPVVHRDIKPDNIIRSEDGRLWLVDFGAVRDFTTTLSGGSTVVGTYGYMAPEQFRGQAVAASDVYGVAATLLYLLTGRPPTELPQEKLKVAFRAHVRCSPRLVAWLDRALEPAPEDRFATAGEALAALRGGTLARPSPSGGRSGARTGILLAVLACVIGAAAIVGVREVRREVASKAAGKRAAVLARGPLEKLPRRPEATYEILQSQATFKGHMALILSLAVSPDDKTMATGSDGSVKLWDLSSGEAVHTLGGVTGRVGALAFTRDGAQIVASGSAVVHVWDVAKGTLLRTIEHAHDREILDLTMSPDGKTLFTASQDGNVKAWDFEAGRERRVFAHGAPVFGLAVSPDGRWLATGARDGTLKFWSVSAGSLMHTTPAHTKTVNSIAFSPDGSVLATAGDDFVVRGWSVDRNGRVQSRYRAQHYDEVWGVAFSPDGRLLASASKDNTVKIIEAMDGSVLTRILGNQWATKVAFTHDSRSLLASFGPFGARYSVSLRRSGTKLPEPPSSGPLVPPTKSQDEALYVEAMRLMMMWPEVRLEDAEAKLDEAIKLDGASRLAWVGRAQFALKQAYINGESYEPRGVALAQAHLERAAALGPKGVEWWSVRAWVARAQGNPQAAREAIREAYARVPHEPYAALAEVKLAISDKHYASAVTLLGSIVTSTRRPEILAWAYAELATAYEHLGDLDAADAAHQRRLALFPRHPWAHGNYATFIGDYLMDDDRALTEADVARGLLDYAPLRSIVSRARVRRANKALWGHLDVTAAARDYEEALASRPDDRDALYGRAAVYRVRAQDEHDVKLLTKARADLERALAKTPNWELAQTALAELDEVAKVVRPP